MTTDSLDEESEDIFVNIHDEKEGLLGRLVGEAFGHGKPFDLIHVGVNGALFEADDLELIIILYPAYKEPEWEEESEPYLVAIIKTDDGEKTHVNADSYGDLLKIIASTVSRIK